MLNETLDYECKSMYRLTNNCETFIQSSCQSSIKTNDYSDYLDETIGKLSSSQKKKFSKKFNIQESTLNNYISLCLFSVVLNYSLVTHAVP